MIPGNPTVTIAVLGRSKRWSDQFVHAMGWELGAVTIVTHISQLMSLNGRVMIFELAGWTTAFPTLKHVNEIAGRLAVLKRLGAVIVYLEGENFV